MPVSTRARPSTPDRPIHREADTEKKARFYLYWEEHGGILSNRQIAKDCGITAPTVTA